MIKSIAVSMSSRCVSNCTFCYRKQTRDAERFYLSCAVRKLARENPGATVCWEYNGWNLRLLETFLYESPTTQTLTTMPLLVDRPLARYLVDHDISAVALSYDSQKCTEIQWIEKAKILKEAGLKVSCNFLLEPGWTFPLDILTYADQVNFLSFKPTGKVEELTAVKAIIELVRCLKPVATDNCLAVQLGTAPDCGRGRDFIHVLSDGTNEDCSFQEKCFLFPAASGSGEPSVERNLGLPREAEKTAVGVGSGESVFTTPAISQELRELISVRYPVQVNQKGFERIRELLDTLETIEARYYTLLHTNPANLVSLVTEFKNE